MTYNYSSTAGEYALASPAAAAATLITLDSVTGLPSVPFKLVIDPGLVSEEIVKVTNVAGTTLTVERGHDSSLAADHAGLAVVRHMMTAEDLRLSRQHEAATAAHGVSGDVVGTSDTQTITNKDLSSATNTFPATLATDTDLATHEADTSTHGVTGAVVGTTDTQTLSNKTLDNPAINGSLVVGSTGSATKQEVRAERLGLDSVSREAALYVNNDYGDGVAFLALRKGGSAVNSLRLYPSGLTETYGPLSVGGDITAPNIVTLTGTETLTNKNLSSATNTFPTNLTASKVVSATGGTGKRTGWGSITTATFASGDYTVTHGLGFTPSQVFLNADVSASVFTLGMKAGASITSTQFVVRAVVWDTGTAGPELYSGPVGNLRWFAIE